MIVLISIQTVKLDVMTRTMHTMKRNKMHCITPSKRAKIHSKNRKNRGKIDINNTNIIHDRSLFLLGTGISMKSGGNKLILFAKNFPLSEMTRSCKCFPRVSKMPTHTYN